MTLSDVHPFRLNTKEGFSIFFITKNHITSCY